MKIEMAPWAKSLTRNMEAAYTELQIEKTEDSPTGTKYTPITDYRNLFKDVTRTSKPKRKRILGKGDPGIGKTTFSKKAAWDWARGIFTTFSIVFFVSLKLVQPGDAIENMIIQQTPVLQGLNVTEEKLTNILSSFGSKCLIILDGYDEFVSENKENKDLIMLLKGQKFPRCNAFLTSRPHCVADIKIHFDYVVSIGGFTKELAEKFAADALKDPSQATSVLEIQCVNAGHYLTQTGSLYVSPMLLLFICILVNSQGIDPNVKKITVGEIFWKLIRCIYQKYCDNKGIEFIEDQFCALVNKISEIAYKTFLFGEYFFKREKISQYLGSDAFTYGFLIGQEDTRMIPESKTNVLVTFPHGSIEQFFCSFKLVTHMSLPWPWSRLIPDDAPTFMIDPLFFHFCLWFMYHSEQFNIPAISSQQIFTAVQNEILRLCDRVQLEFQDLESVYKAINFGYVQRVNDEATLNFFKQVFEQFKRTRYLTMVPKTAFWTLSTFRHILKQLSVITIQSFPYFKKELPKYTRVLSAEKREDLTLIIRGNCKELVEGIMKYPEISQRHPSVYMYFDRCHDLSSLLHKDMKELHLKNPHGGALMTLTAKQEIKMCPYLTDLSFTSVGDTKIDPAVCSLLSTAVGIGTLPCLNHLGFSGSGTAIKGHLSKLFSSEWTTLKHLNLYKCELDKNDVNHLAKHHISLFPNILSLVLYFGKINKPETETNTNLSSFASILLDARQKGEMKVDLAVKLLFNSPWPTLTSIFLHDMTAEAYREFSQIMMKGSLPNLTKLGISMWNLARIIPNNLAPFESPLGTILRQIALQQFLFRKEYVSILAGRLFFAQLHELDISHSFGVRGNLSLLLCHPLPELRALILNGCEFNSDDLQSLAKANQNGRLPKLKNLDVTGNTDSITSLFHDSCTLDKLLTFKMSHHLTQDSSPECDKG